MRVHVSTNKKGQGYKESWLGFKELKDRLINCLIKRLFFYPFYGVKTQIEQLYFWQKSKCKGSLKVWNRSTKDLYL